MSNEITDNLVDVEDLLRTLARACMETARHVDSVSDDPMLGRPVRYIVPSFKVSVKLSFTKTGSEVKGLLFWKRSEGETSEALSQIEMQIVAVPRTPSAPG